MTFTTIGQPTPLIDGNVRVTGGIQYATNVRLPGMLHARFVGSLYPHARIRHIDVEAARALPGVVAVLTAADLPEINPKSRHRLLLARDRTLFVGQPVALVLATSEAAAQDGVEAVLVEYDPLPAAVSMEEALAEEAPLVWPDGVPGDSGEAAAHGADVAGVDGGSQRPSNISNRTHFTRGDVAAGFAQADVVVERTFTTSMVHQSYLEPHATVAQPDPLSGGATVWTSTQAPFYVQQEVAELLGVADTEVRVIPTPVGGGFGGKFILYEPLVALAARAVGQPVRLVLTRMEEMHAGNPAPAARFALRLGAKRDGTLTAIKADLTFDCGCYPGSPVGIAGLMLGSLYQTENLDIRGTEVLTFKPSQGAYRAPGAPQATYVIESAMNELAERLGIDPIELRLKNASRPGDPMAHGRPWPSMGMREVLEALREHPAWQQREVTRVAGRGVGIAIGGWPGGTEPAAAVCKLQRDGTLQIQVGSVDLTGTSTGFALLAAESFGISPDQVRVFNGDTTTAPYSGAAGGSKITYTVGQAVMKAAREAREQVLKMGAEMLEADPEDMEIVDSAVQVRGVPDRKISLKEMAAKTMDWNSRYAPIIAQGRYAEQGGAPGFCAQLAEVEVDERTGQILVHRLVVVQDVGRALNPLTLQGQMQGGAAQGLGWALYEGIIYDDQGQLLTGSLMDYCLPKSAQIAPEIETVMVEVPSPAGPFGARGVGEPPVIPTAGAVANGIADAVAVRLTALPMTSSRLLAALHGNGRATG